VSLTEGGQYVFVEAVEAYLRDLDFDPDMGMANKWWRQGILDKLSQERLIVQVPERTASAPPRSATNWLRAEGSPPIVDELDDDLPSRQGLAPVRGLRRCR